MTTICVDVLGGDEPAEVVLEGIAEALASDKDLNVLVAGREEDVVPFCEKNDRARPLVCTEAIAMDEHPADAVRNKRDSTIVRGCQAVREGEADGFFSAGSTGAIFAAATLHIGRIKGIKRPALAIVLPAANGRNTVFLDLGANADVRPEMIVQFARMGRAYAGVVLDVEDPKVALLSNGAEDTKGSEMILGFHEALAELGEPWFVGNAEGSDLLAGTYDVIVCDGFTGNVALKTIEGTAKYVLGEIKGAMSVSKRAVVGAALLKPTFKKLAWELSGEERGGAILLGAKAPVVIGHGATSAKAVSRGTLETASIVRTGLVERIASSMTQQ